MLRLGPILFLLLSACGVSSEAPEAPIFRFSAIPDEKPTEQRARFEPVARYLLDRTGVLAEYVPVSGRR